MVTEYLLSGKGLGSEVSGVNYGLEVECSLLFLWFSVTGSISNNGIFFPRQYFSADNSRSGASKHKLLHFEENVDEKSRMENKSAEQNVKTGKAQNSERVDPPHEHAPHTDMTLKRSWLNEPHVCNHERKKQSTKFQTKKNTWEENQSSMPQISDRGKRPLPVEKKQKFE